MAPFAYGKSMMFAAAAVAALALPSAAFANKANDTLVYASDSEPENISPYHNNLREGVIIAHLVWDTLVYRNPKTGEYEPELATSWKWVDPVTLELSLRKGVTFQDGSPFTADDVVFTFNYVLTPEAKVVTKQNVEWMAGADKVDDYTVRVRLKGPFPAALKIKPANATPVVEPVIREVVVSPVIAPLRSRGVACTIARKFGAMKSEKPMPPIVMRHTMSQVCG